MNYLLLILLLLLPQQQVTPQFTASWQGNALHVTWAAPGWHTVSLDHTPLDQGYGMNAGIFDMPTGGVDHLYHPKAGQVLRLMDENGNEVAQVIVPIRLTPRSWLPLIRAGRLYRVRLPWVQS